MKREVLNIFINLFSRHSLDVTMCRDVKQAHTLKNSY